jgi:hypothetical protein
VHVPRKSFFCGPEPRMVCMLDFGKFVVYAQS